MSKHIILVDDSKTILASSEMAFEDMVDAGELVVTTYVNPIEMLEDVKSGKISYDLAILDINMPQMNGLDLARELKTDPSLKMKPVLMLTTESSGDMKIKGKEIGVTGWMVKPFSDAKLVKSVKMVLGI